MTQERFKFRAWDRDNKVWLNLWQIMLANDGSVVALKDMQCEQYGTHQVDLIYSTGLLDKNGVLIFEGDVLDRISGYSSGPKEVFWDEGTWSLKKGVCFTQNEAGWWKKIGNIYEHPELLKVGA